jgi:hypothetical protein
MLTGELVGDLVPVIVNGVRAYQNIKTGEIIYNESYVAGSGMGNIAKGGSKAEAALDDGLGTYASQGGHHPMAKSAFNGVIGYDYKEALSISASKLAEFDVTHATITGQQIKLYSAFSKTGESLTIDAMKQIEIKAMTNSGVPLNYAKNAVEKAIAALKEAGITQPSRIPWGK